jgi:hypothetical protein
MPNSVCWPAVGRASPLLLHPAYSWLSLPMVAVTAARTRRSQLGTAMPPLCWLAPRLCCVAAGLGVLQGLVASLVRAERSACRGNMPRSRAECRRGYDGRVPRACTEQEQQNQAPRLRLICFVSGKNIAGGNSLNRSPRARAR